MARLQLSFAGYHFALDLRPRPARPAGRAPRVRARALALASAATAVLAVLPAAPAQADSSGGVAATINIAIISITVSPSSYTFKSCRGGNSTPTALGFPNGVCVSYPDVITINNTGAASHIQVQGSDAIPADNLTPWTLCGAPAPLGPACSVPGSDQYRVGLTPGVPGSGEYLAITPQCDTALTGSGCAAAANSSHTEYFQVDGPSASTDTSLSFSFKITYIAVL